MPMIWVGSRVRISRELFNLKTDRNVEAPQWLEVLDALIFEKKEGPLLAVRWEGDHKVKFSVRYNDIQAIEIYEEGNKRLVVEVKVTGYQCNNIS